MSKTKRIAGIVSALLAVCTIQATHAAAAQASTGSCAFIGTLCVWDQPDFQGEQTTFSPLPPKTTACIDLTTHGWADRIRSAINTSSKSASLFTTADCTGQPYQIAANTGRSSITYAARSVWVQR